MCLGGQELPSRGSAPRDGTQTVSAQDPSDRAGRDPDAELSQLALDANASPAPVLLTQTDDELHQFSAYRRATWAPLPSPLSPLVLGCLAMPPQQGLWGDHERAPSGSGEQPAECGEDCPIRWPMFDTPVELPLENTDLVSEHHDLDVPLGLGPSTTTQRNRTCDTGRGRGARRAHRIMSETAANFLVKGPIVLLVSFRTRVRRTGHLSAKCHHDRPPMSASAMPRAWPLDQSPGPVPTPHCPTPSKDGTPSPRIQLTKP